MNSELVEKYKRIAWWLNLLYSLASNAESWSWGFPCLRAQWQIKGKVIFPWLVTNLDISEKREFSF